MSKVLTTLRTHWKKSLAAGAAASYGAHYAWVKHKDFQTMRAFCLEAYGYGQQTMGCYDELYSVTVILNPAASGGEKILIP